MMVPGGSWLPQMYMSAAYGGGRPVIVSASLRWLRSAKGSLEASPSKATTTRRGASSRWRSELSARGTRASVFQDQRSQPLAGRAGLKAAPYSEAEPSACACSTWRPSWATTWYCVSRLNLDSGAGPHGWPWPSKGTGRTAQSFCCAPAGVEPTIKANEVANRPNPTHPAFCRMPMQSTQRLSTSAPH